MLLLEGTTVVSLEQAVAAPYATRQLADLGARVIKVERPEGDFARRYDESVHGQSSYFVWLNRSKESIALDLKVDEQLQVLHRLLESADVFVQNLAPGAAERLGLSTTELTRRYPRLIVCNISGYNQQSAWAQRKAYDLLIQCEAGVATLTGSAEEPAKAGISIADIAAGMYGFSAILAALYARAVHGIVTPIEVSLFDALVEWVGSPLYYAMYSHREPPRVGLQHATIAPYGPYHCRDGATIVIGLQNEHEWASFCERYLSAPELTNDVRFLRNSDRVANRNELNAIIQARFDQLNAEEALALLEVAGVANAKLNTMAQLSEHPALVNRWREVDTPAGSIRALLPPITFGALDVRFDPVPGVGEHTEQILASLQLTRRDIED